ncbi:MAG TPA: alpha-galactosidase [Ilumatobacteraceae bacterium]|nr:alpha-galactosidase [Ilumatobacteraceae bacterium]
MIHLRGATADVVLDTQSGAPTIVYWGAPLGDVDPASVATALQVPVAGGSIDVVAPLSIVPEHGSGFAGRPGLNGHRQGGAAWSPRFTTGSVQRVEGGVVVTAVDEVAGLHLVTEVQLADVLAVRCSVTNLGTTRYLLDGLHPTLPLPERATELLTFDGRWTREFQPVRRPWPSGTWTGENRSGRTSHEHVPLVFAGTPGFGEWAGEVWGVHLAWSGNSAVFADCLVDGRRYVQCGELLHPGEWCLEPGDEYHSPWVYGVWSGGGLTPASWGFHRQLRSFGAVSPERPRPVLLNTWEAVYFQQSTTELSALADVAASLGVERFVLDDGWFGSRRDDWRGLGDWWVSPDVFPDGLAPLIAHVRGLGMEFGIWVEPEMVNPDSDLYRAHPDWVLATDGYAPVLGRHQLVLDVGRADVFQYLLDRLDALLRDHDIAYVKWDMNRPHVQGSGVRGAAGSHRQTLALLALLDELRARHPSVEFESCASGGGRIDLGILARTARVWTSDCNDPLERQTINFAASMLIPYEVLGAHIGPTRAHTTGRVHSLAFRGLTAMFGHLGVEWDVRTLTDAERVDLAAIIALHQQFRGLIHSGDVVRFDTADPSVRAYGVYSADRTEALIAHAQISRAAANVPPTLRLPGLLADRRYHLTQVPVPGSRVTWAADGSVFTGRQLGEHGVRPPLLFPESGVLFRLAAVT